MLMRFSVILIAALAFAGCKGVRVERGEVPDEYLAVAQKYMGSYAGPNGALQVSLVGRQVKLAYVDRDGRAADILDERCESRIGRLQTVSMTPAGVLQSATFAFDPNRCWGSVDGRTLKIDFASVVASPTVLLTTASAVNAASASLVRTSILIRNGAGSACRIEAGNPRTGTVPHQVCGDARAVYASKIFQK